MKVLLGRICGAKQMDGTVERCEEVREWYLPQGLSPRELSLDLSMKHNESRQSLLFSDFSIGMDFFFDYFFGYFFFMIAILVWIQNLYSSCQNKNME